MTQRRFNPPLWIGMALSIAVHSFVLLPLLIAMMSTAGGALALSAQFNPDDVHPPQPHEQPDVKLGIDEGAPSTLTWLGYREYQQHQAPPADVEQAAFTDDPSTPAPLSMNPQDQPGEAEAQSNDTSQGAEQSQTTMQEPVELPAPPQQNPTDSPAEADAPQPADAAPVLTEQNAQPAEVATSPRVSPMQGVVAFAEQLRQLLEQAASAEVQAEVAQRSPAANANESDSERSETTEAQAASTSPTDPAAAQAEMDSDPSSAVEVPFDDIRLGKPLAARGLTLRPQKPEFTTLTLMTAAPRNPLVEMKFLSTGRVLDARIVESSNDQRVDRAIEASLFRWRAEGKQLESLTGERTIAVQIRFILNRRP